MLNEGCPWSDDGKQIFQSSCIWSQIEPIINISAYNIMSLQEPLLMTNYVYNPLASNAIKGLSTNQ